VEKPDNIGPDWMLRIQVESEMKQGVTGFSIK